MFVYVCKCIHVRIHICIYTYVYIHVYVCMYVYLYINAHITVDAGDDMYISTYIYIDFIYLHIYTYLYIYIYTPAYINTQLHIKDTNAHMQVDVEEAMQREREGERASRSLIHLSLVVALVYSCTYPSVCRKGDAQRMLRSP